MFSILIISLPRSHFLFAPKSNFPANGPGGAGSLPRAQAARRPPLRDALLAASAQPRPPPPASSLSDELATPSVRGLPRRACRPPPNRSGRSGKAGVPPCTGRGLRSTPTPPLLPFTPPDAARQDGGGHAPLRLALCTAAPARQQRHPAAPRRAAGSCRLRFPRLRPALPPFYVRERGPRPRVCTGARGRGPRSPCGAEEATGASSLTAAYSRLPEEPPLRLSAAEEARCQAGAARRGWAVRNDPGAVGAASGAAGQRAGEIGCCLSGCGFWWAARRRSGRLGSQRDSPRPPPEGPVPDPQPLSSRSPSAAGGRDRRQGP